MPASAKDRRRGNRWKAGVLMPAALVMVSNSVMPLRAADPVHTPSRPTTTPKISKPHKPKKKKKTSSVEGMIEDVFGERAHEATRIAHCESKFSPDAVSSAGAVGIFQIRERLHGWRVKKVRGKHLRDPRTNIRVAYSLMKDEGWTPWVCARILGITRGGGSRTQHHQEWSSERRSGMPRVPRRPRVST